MSGTAKILRKVKITPKTHHCLVPWLELSATLQQGPDSTQRFPVLTLEELEDHIPIEDQHTTSPKFQ